MAAQSLLHGLPATPVYSLSSSSFMLQKSSRMLFLCSHFMYEWGGQCAILLWLYSFHVVACVAIVSFRYSGATFWHS